LLGVLTNLLAKLSKQKDCFSLIDLLKEIWRVEHFEKYLLLAFYKSEFERFYQKIPA